jgi:hypothetical protein
MPDVQRPRYFDHQFLREDDFNAEQGYHRRLRALHNSTLHTRGVTRGLGISVEAGASEATVQPGSAIDTKGNDIVLDSPQPVDIGQLRKGSDAYVVISYAESDISDPDTGEVTRVTERPTVTARGSEPDDLDQILLGVVRRGDDKTALGPAETSMRPIAGAVAGDISVTNITMRVPETAAAEWPRLRGSGRRRAELSAGLDMTGPLTVGGEGASAGSLSVSGETGIRQERLYLSGGTGDNGWSSVSFNAHHTSDLGWTFPQNDMASVTLEMDALSDGRLELYTRPGGGAWRRRWSTSESGGVVFDEGITVSGPLTVTGQTTVQGALGVNGALTVDAAADVGGPLTARGELSVAGRTRLAGALAAGGSATVNGSLGVTAAGDAQAVTVSGETGIRQERLYISGGTRSDGWSSVSFNARHTAGLDWAYPEPAMASVTLEMDAVSNGRLELYTRPGGGNFRRRFSVTEAGGIVFDQGITVNGPLRGGRTAIDTLFKVVTASGVVRNAGGDAAGSWGVDYGGLAEAYGAYVVMTGFNMWGDTGFRTGRHYSDAAAIPQNVWVRLDSFTSSRATGAGYCSESNVSGEPDNVVYFTVVIFGRAA